MAAVRDGWNAVSGNRYRPKPVPMIPQTFPYERIDMLKLISKPLTTDATLILP